MRTSRRDVDRERRDVDQGEWDHGHTLHLCICNLLFVQCTFTDLWWIVPLTYLGSSMQNGSFLFNNFLALFCWPAPIGASNNCCRSQQRKLSIFQAGAIFQTNIIFQHFCWVRRVLFSRPTSNYATINWIPACQNAVEMDKIVQSFGIKLDCKSFRIKNAACCTPHNVQNSWRQRVIGIIGNSAL